MPAPQSGGAAANGRESLGGSMFSKCSNPECRTPFDYRRGRLIRFNKPPLYFRVPIRHGCVEHFWLCESCAKFYAFDFEHAAGMKIKIRVIGLPEGLAHNLLLPAAKCESNRAKSSAREIGTEATA
jgi:hypothetical protein